MKLLVELSLQLTGMWIKGAPSKYEEKSSASKVALIKISFNSGRRGRRSLRTMSRKSDIINIILETFFTNNKTKTPISHITFIHPLFMNLIHNDMSYTF